MFFLTYLLLFLFYSQIAHAYLDPGTGSLIIQTIIAGIAAGLFALSNFWDKFKSFFKSNKKNGKKKKK